MGLPLSPGSGPGYGIFGQARRLLFRPVCPLLLRYMVERRLWVGGGGRLGALGAHAGHLALLTSWPLVQHLHQDNGDHDRQREDVHDHI